MFRIQNASELSRHDRARRRDADERFAARLASELARLANIGRSYAPSEVQRVPRIARYVVEPTSKRATLWRRHSAHSVTYEAYDMSPSAFERVALSERKYLRALWRVSLAWPVRAERLDLWKR